jgi:hypothetical protein
LHLLGIQLLGALAEPVTLHTFDHHVQLVDLGPQPGFSSAVLLTNSCNLSPSSGRFLRSMATASFDKNLRRVGNSFGLIHLTSQFRAQIAHRRAPLTTFEKRAQLTRGKRNKGCTILWPREPGTLQPLGQKS